MSKPSIIQVRIEDELKKDVLVVLDKIGIDMPTAMRMFLKRIVYENKIPFDINVITDDSNENEAAGCVANSVKPAKLIPMEEYHQILKQVPPGNITRREDIENYFKRKYNVDRVDIGFSLLDTDPLWEKYPYWRIVSSRGMLPQTSRLHSQEKQTEFLKKEGLNIIPCGAYGKSLKVEDYQDYLFNFNILFDK